MKKASIVRKLVYGAVLAAVALLVVWSLLPKPVSVEATTVTRGPLVQEIREDGKARVKSRYLVLAPVTGRLVRIELDPGDEVHTGAVLARLLPATAPLLDVRTNQELRARLGAAEANLALAQTAIAQARVAEKLARDESVRLTKMAAAGAVSPREAERAQSEAELRQRELQGAEFRYHAAGHEVELARAALSGRPSGDGGQLVIRSPVDGTVLRVAQESEAALIAAGTPLLEVGDRQELEVVVDVLSSDAVRIPVTAPVEITDWGGPKPLRGRVRTVEPAAFTKLSALGVEEQRVNVVIDLLSAPADRPTLGDGYRVEASIRTAEVPDAIQVPLGALFRAGGKWAVFIVDGGVAKVRTIEIGLRNDRAAVVTSGLAAGETVIVYPGDNVNDGARVSAQ